MKVPWSHESAHLFYFQVAAKAESEDNQLEQKRQQGKKVLYGQVIQVWTQEPFEPPHDKTNKMACAHSEDSDQQPSLIRVFAVCMKKAWVLSYPLSAQQRLWSYWVVVQADLSLCWVHSHFVGFVMRRLTCLISISAFSETDRLVFNDNLGIIFHFSP